MNSAQTYKQTIRQWRPYIIASAIAVCFAICSTFLGWYDEEHSLPEEITEEQEIVQLSKDPSKVPYHDLFVRYAPSIGWDWETLAAVAYHESRFNPQTVSHRGARGLMQIMPAACSRFGLNDSTVFVPEANIQAACKLINRIKRYFPDVQDDEELTKFVLASYNAGPAHILDARRLAKKYGANACSWDDVETFASFLKYEEYYTDPVVEFGKFNSGTTIAYVQHVLHTSRMIKHGEFAMKKKKTPAASIIESTETNRITPDSLPIHSDSLSQNN